MKLLEFLVLLVAIGGFAAVWRLHMVYSKLRDIERYFLNHENEQVHDLAHPVFLTRQLIEARKWFELRNNRVMQLEMKLHQSEDWFLRRKGENPSLQLQERMREICESTVESECAWKEYVWMVEGNLSVALGRESRTKVLQGFRDLQERNDGDAYLLSMHSNTEKLKRADEIFTNWMARLAGTAVDGIHLDIPDATERGFGLTDDEAARNRAIYHS